jgi:hypothetical protein
MERLHRVVVCLVVLALRHPSHLKRPAGAKRIPTRLTAVITGTGVILADPG